MKSQWFELKDKAIQLRKRGNSIGGIEQKLGIPKSTLSGWFRNVQLLNKHKRRLHQRWLNALVKARKKASLWHRTQKNIRLREAKEYAQKALANLDGNNRFILELALAILYAGEGRKTADFTSLGSSDPRILRFYLNSLKKLYSVDENKICCSLHLRADQCPKKILEFWSEELNMPPKNFRGVYKDKRTVGSKTYSHYKGVCNIAYNDVSIKRKLLNIAELFFEKHLGV